MRNPPNILLFLTDDHGPWSFPAYGNRAIRTPHLSRLAEEGTRFANAFTPSPVCSPARACLMTGRTPSQVGIHDWLAEWHEGIGERDWLAGEATLPELLSEAGYYAIHSGKWHLGRSHLTPRGFARSFGLIGSQGSHNGRSCYHQDGDPLELTGNKSTIITDRALAMLDEAPAGRPFFLNVGYIATHSPYRTAAHDPARLAEVMSLPLDDLPPYQPHPWAKNEGLRAGSAEEIADCARGYYAAVREIDHNVGRVLAWLEARGRLEDTLVVYVSDHGCAIGHNGFFGKGNSTRPLNMYEVSLRVPLLMRGPGVARGRVVESNVDHYDLFRALCEWGGTALPASASSLPGRSLAPLTRGETVSDWDDTRFGEYGDLRMIRTPEWKCVRRHDHGPDELYHLPTDPGERCNRAADPAFSGVMRELSTRLEKWYADHEDPTKNGLRVKALPIHNPYDEAWRDGRRTCSMPSAKT